MANMSYCRFRNTLSDLQDCLRALQEGFLDSPEDEDPDEVAAARRLIRLAGMVNEYADQAIP